MINFLAAVPGDRVGARFSYDGMGTHEGVHVYVYDELPLHWPDARYGAGTDGLE